VKLGIEVFEDRCLPALIGLPIAGTLNLLANPYVPPQPTAAGLALINSLPDTPVRSTALADYQRDGMITRNDMIDIFNNVSLNLTADEINSLGTLVYNGPSTLAMPDYVQNLAWKCFNGIGVGGAAGAQILAQNVDNFFLGHLRPDTTGYYYDSTVIVAGGKPGVVKETATYIPVQTPLWNGSPRYQDVASAQAYGSPLVNDNWLMSGLAELASRNPGDIQRMFIDNGDGSFTVRLYNGGTPDYVTVDNLLPFINYPFAGDVSVGARSDTCLWAALFEKAYVQEKGGTYQQALGAAGADPTWALSVVDGPAGWFGQANFSTTINPLAIASDWSHGDFVVLRGTPIPVDNGVWAVAEADSYYALVGVDIAGGWFTFSDNHGTLYQMDTAYLQANFDGWFQASAQVPPSTTMSVVPLNIQGILTPAAASTLALTVHLSAPGGRTAGVAQIFDVTALDANGNVVTGYSGTVHFSSSDALAGLPGDYTFQPSDNGRHTFSVILYKPGIQSITATDTTNSTISDSAAIKINPAPATSFSISAANTAIAGNALAVTVTALDAYGNVATGYSGTIHFTSNDARAILPANATLTNGTATFSVTLKTAGSRSITVTDTAHATLTRTLSGITVTPAAASQLLITGPRSVIHGIAQAFTVRIADAYGNTVTGYRGTVHFSSSDRQAVLPADYSFTATDAGKHTFRVIFKTPGTQWLEVGDTADSALTGKDLGIVVV
jgi:hypothetical protein